jgi:hypothetical protein
MWPRVVEDDVLQFSLKGLSCVERAPDLPIQEVVGRESQLLHPPAQLHQIGEVRQKRKPDLLGLIAGNVAHFHDVSIHEFT